MIKKLFFAILTCSIALIGCEDNSSSAGSSVLPPEDDILVNVDTFSLGSQLHTADYIYATPDSFLLGECDNQFGTIHADILAQFACPVGFQFPEGAEVDSVCVYLYYRSWFGDGNSPMQISIHKMDRGTFSYSAPYPSNLPLSDYCSYNETTDILGKKRIITAALPTDSLVSSSAGITIPYIRCKTTDAFAKEFFEKADFSSQEAFNNTFNGLYITSDFGSATVLHISDLSISLHYHFTYQKSGKDTTVNDVKAFYANTEVRQINRVEYINSQIDNLRPYSDSINFIVSPANIYTRLSIPMLNMDYHITTALGDKRPYVNQAKLQIDVLNKYTGTTEDFTYTHWAQPANYMLLIKENSMERFFDKKELPSDTCAILTSLSSRTDSLDNVHYFYEYDLSTILTKQLRAETKLDSLQLVLVPVSVETSSSSDYYGSTSTTINAITPQQTISATTIRSAQNKEHPMRLEVIYCGF